MKPAIRFPRTVVELKAIAALIMIPRKLNIWPFRDLSMGSERMKINNPIRIKKNVIVPFVIFPFKEVDLILLKIHVFKINSNIKTNKVIAGSMNDSNIFSVWSILNIFYKKFSNYNEVYQ